MRWKEPDYYHHNKAIDKRDYQTLGELLNKPTPTFNASPMGHNNADDYPIIRAAGHGDLECLRMLINAGHDIDLEVDGKMPILEAMEHDNIVNTRLLLENGVDTNKAYQVDRTIFQLCFEEMEWFDLFTEMNSIPDDFIKIDSD